MAVLIEPIYKIDHRVYWLGFSVVKAILSANGAVDVKHKAHYSTVTSLILCKRVSKYIPCARYAYKQETFDGRSSIDQSVEIISSFYFPS